MLFKHQSYNTQLLRCLMQSICLDVRVKRLSTYLIVIHLLILGEYVMKLSLLLMLTYTIAISGQDCTDTFTVGSLSYDNNLVIVTLERTYILAGYTVPCNGTVVAWEFCYQILDVTVTFYPGIWRITGTMGNNTDYRLVQSNTVTYNQSVRDPQDPNFVGCQIFNLSDTDQFTAPAGSVVGLYSGNQSTQLLRTTNTTNSSITTYRLSVNQNSVSVNDSGDVNYNIAIRVYLGKS